MGVSVGSQAQEGAWSSLRFLTRRKQVDSARGNAEGLLAKDLSIPHLIAVGNSFNLSHLFIY